MKQLLYACFFLLFIFSFCKSDSDDNNGTSNSDYMNREDCTGITPTYNPVIKSIFDNSCALSGCHNASTASDGVNLETYDAAKAAFNAQPFLCAINWGNGCIAMPQGGSKLSASTIISITCWAKNGFPL